MADSWKNSPASDANDFLRCLLPGSSQHSRRPIAEDSALEAEVYRFVCAVMHPDSHLRWGYISAWQRDLQARCWKYDFTCPFWYFVIYGLDLGLHVEAGRVDLNRSDCDHHGRMPAQVEVFIRVLLEQSWAPELLHKWQLRLRAMTRNLWLPCRLWFEAIHDIDFTAEPVRVQATIAAWQRIVKDNAPRNN
eukprot:Skav204373  [mRNA]  locus=scaffold1480:36807:37379:+ [translate_table: standard]